MGVFGALEGETEPEFKSVSAALEFKTAIHDMNEGKISTSEKENYRHIARRTVQNFLTTPIDLCLFLFVVH